MIVFVGAKNEMRNFDIYIFAWIPTNNIDGCRMAFLTIELMTFMDSGLIKQNVDIIKNIYKYGIS